MRSKLVSLAIFSAILSGTFLVAQTPKPAEPEPKAKGQLPQYWKQIGLTEDQVQKVYKIQNKYNADIDKLEAQIKELKDKMAKERSEVLTAEQKKRLEDIIKGKAGTDK